jgi:hypothetical protein
VSPLPFDRSRLRGADVRHALKDEKPVTPPPPPPVGDDPGFPSVESERRRDRRLVWFGIFWLVLALACLYLAVRWQ